MDAVDTSTKRERSSNKDRESRPDERGGCRKNNTPEPHRTPCQLRRRGRMGHGAFWKRFFGALDGLSRRTLILLPPSAERPLETPLFDSTPPAVAAMVAAAVSRRHMRPWPYRSPCVAQRRPWRGPSVTGLCVTPRRPCDAENRRTAGNCEDWARPRYDHL